jgi:hypothetical protein
MKTALKCKNGEFLVMPLKHVLSVMGHVNPPEPQTVGNYMAHDTQYMFKRHDQKLVIFYIFGPFL